ncbi:HDR129Cp [Eremothecium sinecaudum]|uniref:Endoplasmic reticulum transmembrane protein n=1 Tax=Eremothecium sinecaudum TaxID=45286 RepID=A0A0X8HSX7_9SACH|nr:HDR129Cp [Eremothecium sinecaudum]AMD20871.1 HDR129Cp [Eremothecium sinecaudum]
MSMYLTILFGLLVTEMSLLFVLVLPLPFTVRRSVVRSFEQLMAMPQLKTIAIIGYVLVGMMFVDSWKRAGFVGWRETENLGHVRPSKTIQEYTTRAYNQRNLYLSGFVLYFNLCIPTVINILHSLVKHEELSRSGSKTAAESEKMKQLRKELAQKEASLEALKKQKAGLEAHFDASVESKEKTSTKAKKED